jgi:hypothetical protein
MTLLNLNSPEGRSPRGKKSSRVWMGFGLIIAVLGLGSTFAANININGQDPNTEFGQGVTKTVFCGALEEPITVTPISKFVNEYTTPQLVSAAISARSEVSFDFNFARSVYSTQSTNASSDFIVSNVQPKTVLGKRGVWLTKKGNSNSVEVASNQNELTFDSDQRKDYVFSQDLVSRRNGGSSNVNGYWKVNETSNGGKIVVTPAIAARSAQYNQVTTPDEFYFNGVVISDIPESCIGKNFIISGYGQTGDALTLIDLDNQNDSISEITALWTGEDEDLKVSKSRLRFVDIKDILDREEQDEDRLEIVFGRTNYSNYLKTEDLYRLVIETQEDTLTSNNNNDNNNDDNNDDNE